MDVVSLFAGCGGLDLGFEQAGFNVVWSNSLAQTIQPTYKLSHPNTIFCDDDIRAINTQPFSAIQFLARLLNKNNSFF
ncbi:MAG: DNA cytosine methyltransferase [Bacteroidales bacterium]|nr:DNA cytosine methyltransferase [Bacteroidales bacterium]